MLERLYLRHSSPPVSRLTVLLLMPMMLLMKIPTALLMLPSVF